jgi:LDH2 family malate/lactate/ureidoglycolate dehydrogenase
MDETDEISGVVWLKKLRLPGLEQTERKAERQSEGATNTHNSLQKLCRCQKDCGDSRLW